MKTKLLAYFIITALMIATHTASAKWAVVCGYFQNEYHCAAVNRSCNDVTWVPLAEWTCKDLNIILTSSATTGNNRYNRNRLIREKDGKASFLINGDFSRSA